MEKSNTFYEWENCTLKNWIGIIQSLPMNVLLGMTYIDKFISSVFPIEWTIVTEHLVQNAIPRNGTKASLITIFPREVSRMSRTNMQELKWQSSLPLLPKWNPW